MALVLLFELVRSQGIIVANDKNFESRVFGKLGKYSLVNFYSPSCTHCQSLKPNYDPLGELYNGTKVQIVLVNGLENKQVRAKYNIVGFPTIKLYSSDGTQLAAFSHRGERTTENIIKFIEDYTGVKPNKLASFVDYVESMDDWDLIKDENKVVLFTTPFVKEFENKYNNYFISLAKRYPESKFVSVDTSKLELSELSTIYRIDSVPTVMFFKGEELFKLNRVNQYNIELFLNGEEGLHYPFVVDLNTNFEDDDEEEEDDDFEEMKRLREL